MATPSANNSPAASHLSIDERLLMEYYARNSAGVWPGLATIELLWYVFRDKADATWWPVAGITLTLGMLIRAVLDKKLAKDARDAVRFKTFHSALNICNSLAWGLGAASVIHVYGINSLEGTGFQVVNMTFMCAVSYAMAPRPWTQRLYLFFAGTPTGIAVFMHATDLRSSFMGWCSLLLVLYTMSVGKKQYFGLRHSYELDEQIRQEKEKLQNVIDSVPGFVAVADQSGIWLEKSSSFNEFDKQPELIAAREEFVKSLASSKTAQLEWNDPKQKNGTVSYAVSFERVKYPENGIIMAGIPVTELHEAQKQLEAQRSKAEYSARLATLGEMAGGVAHEINNPLAVLSGYATQLSREMKPEVAVTARMVEKVGRIIKTVDRIAKIVQSLRTFSRPADAEPLSPTSLSSIVADTLELCQAKFSYANIDLHVDDVPDLKVSARGTQVGQVLLNLLSNAYDAVEKNSEKKIQIKFVLPANEKEGKSKPSSEQFLKILICDNGYGVPDKVASRIFEPFFTTKDIGQGTGLGLSVSKSIMLEHGGDLILVKASQPTTFELTLAMSEAKAQAA